MSSNTDDESLLFRLNALRKSNITLEKGPVAGENLADRLRNVRGRPVIKHINTSGKEEEVFTLVPKGISDEPDAQIEVASRVDNDFKDALRYLSDAPAPTSADEREVMDALRQAQELLQNQADESEKTTIVAKNTQKVKDATPDDNTRVDADGPISQQDIETLLAELDLEGSEEDTQGTEVHSDFVQLPDTPKGLAKKPSESVEKRGHGLVELPSVPQTKPTTKAGGSLPSVPTSSNAGAAKEDKDVDNWCIICLDDATVRCLGCDGDLYCANCWKEGHVGEDAGTEERSHKALMFDAGGKKKPRKMLA